MKIGPGVSELWGVENRPLPLTRPMAYTTACTTLQAVIMPKLVRLSLCKVDRFSYAGVCFRRLRIKVLEAFQQTAYGIFLCNNL